MINRRITDSQITASSHKGYSYAKLARLHNTVKHGEVTAHWQPNDGGVPYIQIDLTRTHRITAISTQGHFNPSVNEFTTSYSVYYMTAGQWVYYGKVTSHSIH